MNGQMAEKMMGMLGQINEGLRCMRDDLRAMTAAIREQGVRERRCEFAEIIGRLVQRGTITTEDAARLDADVEGKGGTCAT